MTNPIIQHEPGPMEQELIRRRMDLSVNGREPILIFAREQDATRAELLAALEGIVNNDSPSVEQWQTARAAIAKARGQAVTP